MCFRRRLLPLMYVHPNLEQKKKCLDKAFKFMK